VFARISHAEALLLILMVVAATGSWFLGRQGVLPVEEHAPVTVLIADFENTTNGAAFDNTPAQALRRCLESASFITAFDRTRVRRVPDQRGGGCLPGG